MCTTCIHTSTTPVITDDSIKGSCLLAQLLNQSAFFFWVSWERVYSYNHWNTKQPDILNVLLEISKSCLHQRKIFLGWKPKVMDRLYNSSDVGHKLLCTYLEPKPPGHTCVYAGSNGWPAVTVGPPPCILRERTVATKTAQSGTRPAQTVMLEHSYCEWRNLIGQLACTIINRAQYKYVILSLWLTLNFI